MSSLKLLVGTGLMNIISPFLRISKISKEEDYLETVPALNMIAN
jgi:hypothetical protein